MANGLEGDRSRQGSLQCAYHRYKVGSPGWCLPPTEESCTLIGRTPQVFLWLGTYGGWEGECGVLVEIHRLSQATGMTTRTEEES